MKKIIYFILGQTAAGKTDYASSLAREINGELVNCDSRQIYKHLDVITGKTDNPKDINTHMTDIVNPDESYSAYEYARRAYEIIKQISSDNKVPIVVGGTGMYAYLLKYYNPDGFYKKNENRNKFDSVPLEELQNKLKNKFRFIWDKMNDSDRLNKRRLTSALHRLLHNNSQPIDTTSKNCLASQYNIKEVLLLHRDKENLEDKLQKRIEVRLGNGAIEECEKILRLGFKHNDPGLFTIGYQSVIKFLNKMISEKQMIEEWFTKERQYAKRQRTYFLKYFPEGKIILV